MRTVRESESEIHPFEHFKAVMGKLVKVTKAQLDDELREHERTKPERKAGRKAKKRD